jgi:hypothetical protein
MKLAMTLTAVLVLGTIALPANAQNQQRGAAVIRDTATQNATPIIQPIACGGYTGSRGCGPGWTWSDRYRRCVRC